MGTPVAAANRRAFVARLMLVGALAATPAPALLTIDSGPTGLAGETVVVAPPGGSEVIYTVELGGVLPLPRLSQIDIRISPLAAPLSASLAQSDFTSLRLIESGDAVFDGGDAVLNTVASGAIDVTGGITSITDGGNATPLGLGASLFYFIVADMAAGATDGAVFRLGADASHISTSLGFTVPAAPAIVAANADRIVINQLIPLISFSPPSLNFGTIEVGSFRSLPLTVSNVGAALMTVTSIVSSDGQFSPSTTGFALAPTASQVMTVTFTPSSVGLKAGTLAVTFNPTSNVNMSGIGGMVVAGGTTTGRAIPVGWEWVAGLGFATFGVYRILRPVPG